jgi:hypothetical protein
MSAMRLLKLRYLLEIVRGTRDSELEGTQKYANVTAKNPVCHKQWKPKKQWGTTRHGWE